VVALLEVELGAGRGEAGEMEDHIGPRRHRRSRRALRGEIGGGQLHPAGEARRPRGGHHIEQGQRGDRLAVERTVAREPLGQLAADHAGRAGDEDVHRCCSALSSSL
jgi:hypothetical protein